MDVFDVAAGVRLSNVVDPRLVGNPRFCVFFLKTPIMSYGVSRERVAKSARPPEAPDAEREVRGNPGRHPNERRYHLSRQRGITQGVE